MTELETTLSALREGRGGGVNSSEEDLAAVGKLQMDLDSSLKNMGEAADRESGSERPGLSSTVSSPGALPSRGLSPNTPPQRVPVTVPANNPVETAISSFISYYKRFC